MTNYTFGESKMFKNNKYHIAMMLAASCTVQSALANDVPANKPFSVDLGAGHLSLDNNNGDIIGAGIPPLSSVNVKSASSVAMSVSYRQNDNISYQLYLAPPISFDIHATGTLAAVGHISTVDVLLPTVMVNYTFTMFDNVKPYIGAGINYTLFSNEESTPALEAALGGATSVKLENSSGISLQAGVRFDFNDRWYLNANYLWINADSTAHTSTVGINRTVELGLDPSVGYLSVGYRF